MRVPLLRTMPVLVLIGWLLLSGCSRGRDPSILLLTLDTTRADHIGCYGGALSRTPHLDALAEEGIRFEHAYCQAPITIPSHASMLTAQYPRTHGAMGNDDVLSESAPHLAEFLRDRGYRTAAFTSTRILSERSGFDRASTGFDPPATGTPGARRRLSARRSNG